MEFAVTENSIRMRFVCAMTVDSIKFIAKQFIELHLDLGISHKIECKSIPEYETV